MTGIVRPGPDRIEPGARPGGVVFVVYDTATGDCVARSTVTGYDVERIIGEHVVLADGLDAVCLVAYDGDTGERFTVSDWLGG